MYLRQSLIRRKTSPKLAKALLELNLPTLGICYGMQLLSHVHKGKLASGKAADQFRRIIERQGGNPNVLDDPALLPQATECELFTALRGGFVQRVEPRAVGRGIIALGGGRTTMADAVDPAVGFVITAKPGDLVETGEPLASVYARDRAGIERGRAALRSAIAIADEVEPPLPLVSHRVTKSGVEEMA